MFGDARVETAAEQSLAWDAHKAAEREARGVDDLDAVPRALPALLQAAKLARRAERAGRRARDGDPIGESDETAVGDALFELARGASLRGIDPETALRKACERFRARPSRG